MAVLIEHGGEEGDHMQSIQELFDEALAEGAKIGDKIGDWRCRERAAAKMLRTGRYALDEVVEISGLSLNQVMELKEEVDCIQSIQDCIDEARWKWRKETVVRMLRKGRLPLDEIAEYAGLPPDLVKELKAELEA